ncbi:hypothetical protein [Pseudomonas sp. MH10]|uniref:hypothetical protein n=1 Tax=Pseudomonas sp. MH10 TaxID=3048627 RepID=UPI002AC93985|nr:hypothetical protein [Pseudomonas sp. MH10]MEB0040424.1 hypothetical protein [Pseudomonas sp. MH10]WPX61843.1 hypothetical protein RHM59_12820 [Pseudomonas sp. MH10]
MIISLIDPRFPLSRSNAAIVISRLVQAIALTQDPAYRTTLDASGCEQVAVTVQSRLCECLPRISEHYASYRDDEYQDIYWTAYREVGLEDSPVGLVCMNAHETGYLTTPSAINALVDRVRQLVDSRDDSRHELYLIA